MGFAYAFQLLGYLVWQAAESQSTKQVTLKTVKEIQDQYISALFRNVYHKVYHEMSMREREFVQAMVKTGQFQVKAQQIGQLMGKQPGYISVYRRKLIDDQIITPTGYVTSALCCLTLTSTSRNKC
ncbi:MAG: hypothetical protein ACLSH6_04600 [Limosilactobacillus pontis]